MVKRIGVLLGVSCLLAWPLLAQSQSSTADLLGTVSDQSQAVIPGVDITAVNVRTDLTRSTVSDERGDYRLPLLPPGTYELRAELPGFATKVVRGINLTVGQYAQLDVVLEVSATETEIGTYVVSGTELTTTPDDPSDTPETLVFCVEGDVLTTLIANDQGDPVTTYRFERN